MDFSSGQLNTSRRNNPRQNNFQPSGAGADHHRPTQSAQIGPEVSRDLPQEHRSPPMQDSEWTGRGNQQRGNHWTPRGSGPRFGHDSGQDDRPETLHHQGGNGRYNGGYQNNNRNGNQMNRAPSVNFFRSNGAYHQNDRQRPYWIQRNVSDGYYRPRNRRNRPRGNRRNDEGRGNGDNPQHDAQGGPQGLIKVVLTITRTNKEEEVLPRRRPIRSGTIRVRKTGPGCKTSPALHALQRTGADC